MSVDILPFLSKISNAFSAKMTFLTIEITTTDKKATDTGLLH